MTLVLSRIEGLGPRSFLQLLDKFKRVSNIFCAQFEELSQVVPASLAREVKTLDPLKDVKVYLEILKEKEVAFKTILDQDYPELLRQIYDPPIVLYYRGDFRIDDFKRCFSVVGTRNCTSYGEEVTKKLVQSLVHAGFVIVSGMAFGIDKLAHEVSMKNGGRTIAVLSRGVEEPCPKANYRIYEKVLSNGCVVSEYDSDRSITPGMFPSRNRIIAGLSVGILVIEAGEKSGALITAYQGLEQGRDVFAVPASVFNEKGKGTNSLIKKGNAKLVQEASDILEEYGFKLDIGYQSDKIRYSSDEQKIIDCLLREPATVDEIALTLDWRITHLLQVLTMMEIEQKVAKDNRNKYFIVK